MPDKEYERLLNSQEIKDAEFSVLFNRSLIGVCYVRPDGTFIKVNPRFAEMLGYSRKELEGKVKWQDITHPSDADSAELELNDIASGVQESARLFKRYLSKDGSSVFCEVQVERIDTAEGVFVHFLKQSIPLPVPDKNLSVVKDVNGRMMLQPVVPVQEFLVRNWKWVVGTAVPALAAGLTWVGATVSNYYEMKARYEYQQQTIDSLKEKINHVAPSTPK